MLFINISIICVGDLKETFWKDASKEYKKRLLSFCKLDVIEVKPVKCADNPSSAEINSVIQKEGEAIITKIPQNCFVFPLCIEGSQLSSEQFALKLDKIALNGYSRICFIIGGSFGLSDEVKKLASFKFSLSYMTLPHKLARIILLEQIYRAYSINNNSKYHK